MEKTWRGKRTHKYGTWNIRGITGKEIELVKEFKSSNLEWLALTETKKKGNNVVQIDNNYTLIHSGVKVDERARAGVGFLFHNRDSDKLKSWQFKSERLLVVQWNDGCGFEELAVIIAYGPNEDEMAEEKDRFFSDVQSLIDDCKGNCIVVGDLNGRVGNDKTGWFGCLGEHGESVRNNNGERILDLCVANELFVANSMYPYKNIHNYTREEPSRNERSVIDYFLPSRKLRQSIRDVRVKRGYEIGSDHYLVQMDVAINIKQDSRRRRNSCSENERKTKINGYKLKREEVKERYREKVEQKTREKQDCWAGTDLEKSWNTFKNIILEAAEDVCGKSKVGGKRKTTAWWNEEIEREVKKKKENWRKYLTRKDLNDYEDYKRQRKKVKDLVSKSKKASWEEFGNTMESNFKSNSKLFYRVLRNLRKEKEPCVKFVKNSEGRVLTNRREIMARWREYFSTLLGSDSQNRNLRSRTALAGDNLVWEEDDYIEEWELEAAIAKMKMGKSAGHDGISPEMIRYMGGEGVKVLLHIINLIWKQKVIPRDWEVSIIVPIFKKGDNRECSNHRGISLTSVPSKLYARILEHRLRKEIGSNLEDAQYGFRQERSTQDLIFTVRQTSEKLLQKGKASYWCFVDLMKAFDSLPRSVISQVLNEKGISTGLRMAIQSIYKRTRNYVRTTNLESEEFVTTQGVKQGCILSPFLFILTMDEIIKKCEVRMKKLHVGYRHLQMVGFSILAYADDILVAADSEKNLQFNLKVLTEELSKIKMEINVGKSKSMVVGDSERRLSLKVKGTVLEQVKGFKYLGAHLSGEGRMDEELRERIGAAGRFFHATRNSFIGKKEVSARAKVAVFKTVFLPILSYSSESWTLTKRHRSQLQAMEMRFLRKILGKTKRDRIRNVTVRKDLDIEPAIGIIKRSQLRWFGHVLRMADNRIPRLVYEAHTEGRRRRGRPRRTWEEEIRENLLEKGVEWRKGKELARDRNEWERLCKASTLPRR